MGGGEFIEINLLVSVDEKGNNMILFTCTKKTLMSIYHGRMKGKGYDNFAKQQVFYRGQIS